MGVVQSKDFFRRNKIDEACSNTSLSKLRYVAVERPKWKVFGKRELRPITTYPVRGRKGCPCGANGPCKQKVTPKGVTIHYPQKKRFAIEKRYKPPKIEKSYLSDKNRVVNKVKIVRPKKFAIPTWRMDNVIQASPFRQFSSKRRRRRPFRRAKPAPSTPEPAEVKIPEEEKKPEKPSKANKKSKKQLKKELKELENQPKIEPKQEPKIETKKQSKKLSKNSFLNSFLDSSKKKEAEEEKRDVNSD